MTGRQPSSLSALRGSLSHVGSVSDDLLQKFLNTRHEDQLAGEATSKDQPHLATD